VQLPADFLQQCASGQTDFTPCLPDALFPAMTRARQDNVRYSQGWKISPEIECFFHIKKTFKTLKVQL